MVSCKEWETLMWPARPTLRTVPPWCPAPCVITNVSHLSTTHLHLHNWALVCLIYEKYHKDKAMNHLYSFVLAITLLVGGASISTAQDFNKGLEAYKAGDYQTTLQEWRPLAEQGYADAQYNLGVMHDNGKGVPQHNAEDVKWFRLAAEQGAANAQYNMGNMYYNGKGVPQNPAEAVKWFRLAAEQGAANAQYNLGNMYRRGKGAPQNPAEAVKWYRLAAEQGYVNAQYNLGLMYYNGQGVPQDPAEAVKWFRLAAEQGYVNAQTNLGNNYNYGQGVLQSNVMAHMWYNIASANGNSKSGEWRDETAGLMTPADISKAQQMASECMSSNYQNCGE